MSVPGAGFAGGEGRPVALASLEVPCRSCRCWQVLCFPFSSLLSLVAVAPAWWANPRPALPWACPFPGCYRHPTGDLESGTEPGKGEEQTAEGGPRGQMCGREGPAQSPSSLSIGTEELHPTWEGVGSAHCILEGWSLQGGRGKYYGWAETGEAPPLHLPPAAICTPNLPSFLNRPGRVRRWSPPSAQACAAELRSRQGACLLYTSDAADDPRVV